MHKKNYIFLVFLGFFSIVVFYFAPLLFPQVNSFFNNFSNLRTYSWSFDKKDSKDIVVVDVGAETLRKINQKWPLSRSVYGKVLDILKEDGAKVVGFDIVFQGNSLVAKEDDDLVASLAKFGDKVILAAYISNNSVVESLEGINHSARMGFVNAVKDTNGVARRLRGRFRSDNSLSFSLAVHSAAAFYNTEPQLKEDHIAIGNRKVYLDNSGSFLINYLCKSKDFKVVQFYDVVNGNFPKNTFKDKLVLIGSTAEIVHDIMDSPFGRMPGVFGQANGIISIINEKGYVFLPWGVSFLTLISILVIIGFIISSFNSVKGGLLSLGVMFLFLWVDMIIKSFGMQLNHMTIGFFPFRFLNVLSYGPVVIASLGFFLIANCYNYFKFLSVLSQIKSETTVDPFTKLLKLSFFYERVKLDTMSLPRKKCYLVVMVFEGFAMAMKGKGFEQSKKLWLEISDTLLSRSTIWARCSEGVITGIQYSDATLNKLKEALRAIFFEQNKEIKVKIGYVKINSATSIRDVLPYMVEILRAGKEDLKCFDKKDLPLRSQRKSRNQDFISSLYSDVEERNRELLDVIEKLQDEEKNTQDAYLELVTSLVNALESKDPYAQGHTKRVSRYALLLVDKLELSNIEREKIRKASLLHDLGKIGIPDAILQKKGKLTTDEFAFIKEHEVISVRILENIKEFQDILPYILHHHESFDGSGYPHGLAGEFIPYGARIIAVADIYDALTTGRSYKEAFSIKKSIKILREIKGTKLDPNLVNKFIEVIEEQH